MPTPPLSDDTLRAVVEAWRANDCRADLAAAALDPPMNSKTFASRLTVAKARGLHLSEGARGSATRAKLSPIEVRGGHLRVYDDAGRHSDTIQYRVPQDAVVEADYLARMVEAFSAIAPIPPIPAPAAVIASRLATYKLFDWHLGQHSWGRETGGQDYDLGLADSDMRAALAELMLDTPSTEKAIIIFGGDNLHVDDSRAETPAHRHKLDADGRYQKIIDTGVDAIAFACESLLSKHGEVTLVIHRGNHDPHSHIALRTGLRQRYRDNPRITIWNEPFDIFWFKFGVNGIFSNHGDRSKPETLALEIADKCPFYSEVRHRYLYTGHRHRESVQQLPGMLHEGLGPVAPADAYGARFSGRRTMYSTTFDIARGRKARAYDSLDRVA